MKEKVDVKIEIVADNLADIYWPEGTARYDRAWLYKCRGARQREIDLGRGEAVDVHELSNYTVKAMFDQAIKAINKKGRT